MSAAAPSDPADAPAVEEGRLGGWRRLTLRSRHLEVVVLPERGAEIHALTDRASGVDVLFKAPWGLQPPGSPPRDGSAGTEFLANYAGGWQELLPNTNDACTVDGVEHAFHGEVAAVPWTHEDTVVDAAGARVRLSARCRSVPLQVTRTLLCPADRAELHVVERVRNAGAAPVRFTWGHHLVLGAPLVGAGARLAVPAATLSTPREPWEDTARLEPGQRSGWPLARLRGGGTVDLSVLPGPEAASHDDVYLTGLSAGTAGVWNPALGLGFRLDFDPNLFGWVICWQAFGGAHAMPLAGAYALGLEPWSAGGNLAHAVGEGRALELAPGATLATTLVAATVHAPSDIAATTPAGAGAAGPAGPGGGAGPGRA